MAEQDINIQIKTSIDAANAAQTIGGLKRSLVDLQTLAENSDYGKDEIKSLETAISKTTEKMASMKNSVGDIQDKVKTLDGSPIERMKNSFGLLGEGINNLDFGKVIIGIKGIGMAIAANPIGLLLTVVSGLVAVFGDFDKIIKVITGSLQFILGPIQALFDSFGIGKNSVDAATKSLNDYNKAIDDINTNSIVTNASLDSEIKLLEAQGASIDVIAAKKKQQHTDELKRTVEAFNSTTTYLDQLIKLQKKETNGSAEYLELAKKISDARKENQVLSANGIKLANELQIIDINLAKEKKKEADKANEDSIKNQNDANERFKKSIEDELNKLREAEKAKAALLEKGSTIRFEQEMKSIDVIEEFQIKRAKDLEISENGITILKAENIEARKKLEDGYYQYVNKLSDTELERKYKKVDVDVEIKKKSNEIIKQLDDVNFDEINAKRTEKEEANRQKRIQAEIDELNIIKNITESSFSSISTITDAFYSNKMFNLKKTSDAELANLEKGSIEERRYLIKSHNEQQKFAKQQFIISKSLSLSSAIVTGILSTMEAFKNGMKNPVPLLGPATAGVYAAVAGAVSLANIAKIASTRFESKSLSLPEMKSPTTPSSSSSSGVTTQQNQFTPTQFFGLGQTTPQPSNQRVYVVESDITRTQRNVNVVEQRARFG
jgi:hypothetical protein